MADGPFSNSLSPSPGVDCFAVTTSDTTGVFDGTSRYPLVRELLINGASGNLKVTTLAGSDRTIAVITGQVIPVAVTRVFATGTTATGIVAIV